MAEITSEDTELKECDLCEGDGRVIWPEYFGEPDEHTPRCPRCEGTGKVPK
jgi:DnaJ-class molecular chaperone